MSDQKPRLTPTESFNEKALPTRKPLSTNRNSLRKDNPTASVVSTPPEYPEVVRGETEVIENRPSAPESSYHSEDLQSPQLAYNPPLSFPPQQSYMSRAEQGRYYNGVPSPVVEKHYESNAPQRYAWHKIRLLLRLLSIIVVLLPLFIIYGWFNGRCLQDSYGYHYSYFSYGTCWRITLVIVVPVVVVFNLLELIVIGLNGRGTHPSAQLALDLIMGIGLVAAAIYDFKNWNYAWIKVVPSLEIGCAAIHFCCATFDILAIRRLSWGNGRGVSRFPF